MDSATLPRVARLLTHSLLLHVVRLAVLNSHLPPTEPLYLVRLRKSTYLQEWNSLFHFHLMAYRLCSTRSSKASKPHGECGHCFSTMQNMTLCVILGWLYLVIVFVLLLLDITLPILSTSIMVGTGTEVILRCSKIHISMTYNYRQLLQTISPFHKSADSLLTKESDSMVIALHFNFLIAGNGLKLTMKHIKITALPSKVGRYLLNWLQDLLRQERNPSNSNSTVDPVSVSEFLLRCIHIHIGSAKLVIDPDAVPASLYIMAKELGIDMMSTSHGIPSSSDRRVTKKRRNRISSNNSSSSSSSSSSNNNNKQSSIYGDCNCKTQLPVVTPAFDALDLHISRVEGVLLGRNQCIFKCAAQDIRCTLFSPHGKLNGSGNGGTGSNRRNDRTLVQCCTGRHTRTMQLARVQVYMTHYTSHHRIPFKATTTTTTSGGDIDCGMAGCTYRHHYQHHQQHWHYQEIVLLSRWRMLACWDESSRRPEQQLQVSTPIPVPIPVPVVSVLREEARDHLIAAVNVTRSKSKAFNTRTGRAVEPIPACLPQAPVEASSCGLSLLVAATTTTTTTTSTSTCTGKSTPAVEEGTGSVTTFEDTASNSSSGSMTAGYVLPLSMGSTKPVPVPAPAPASSPVSPAASTAVNCPVSMLIRQP